jgi:formate dehydrogenase subunit gamma
MAKADLENLLYLRDEVMKSKAIALAKTETNKKPLKLLMGFLFILMAAFFVMQASSAFAEDKAEISSTDSVKAGNVPGNSSGNSSDSDFWRALKDGVEGKVSIPDKQSGRLIQTQGTAWWQQRNGPVAMFVGWAILGVTFALALFFAIRGRIRISNGRSNKRIKRFSIIERTGHWLLACSFILLALTGLNLLFGRSIILPVIGKEAFAFIALMGKYIHNYVAFAFIAGLVMITVMWIKHNFPNKHDIVWLLKGGGLFGGGHPPAKKFNGGQKILFWLVVICGVSISLSGWSLLYPFTTSMFNSTFEITNSLFGTEYVLPLTPLQEQQYASLWHIIMAGVMIAIVIAHIYIGSVGMEGAMEAMTDGEVDENWAKDHHSIWVAEMETDHAKWVADQRKTQPAE